MTQPQKKQTRKSITSTNAPKHSILVLILAGVFLVVSLMILIAFWFFPEPLLYAGSIEKIWYVLLIFLGLASAISLFFAFKSYGRYSGKVMNGKLELGGPGVLMLAIVGFGYIFTPAQTTKFDVTVFLRLEGDRSSETLQGSKLSLDLGADRREEVIGAKGLVRFIGIPAELKGKDVPVILEAPYLVLNAGNVATISLKREAVYLDVHWKPWILQGQVQNESGTVLSNAEVFMNGQTTSTDANGRFAFTLSTKLKESERKLEVRVDGYTPWRNTVGIATPEIQIQMTRP